MDHSLLRDRFKICIFCVKVSYQVGIRFSQWLIQKKIPVHLLTTRIAAFVFFFVHFTFSPWMVWYCGGQTCIAFCELCVSLGFICFFLSSGCLTDICQSIHVKLCRWSENYVWVFYMVVGCVRLEWKNELLSSMQVLSLIQVEEKFEAVWLV